jgi:transcriptional regulator with XRE-family HTH domain
MEQRIPVVGARLSNARRLAGLTTRELAQLMGLNHVTVRRWECGMRPIGVGSLRALAEFLDTTVSYLIGEEGYDEPYRRFSGAIPFRQK